MVDERDATYRQIREKLLDGTIRSPRDLSRRRLAASLSATPNHTQWALNRMEAEGLLESRPQSGTYVRKLTHREFRELCDVRRLIEPYAAKRAARLITPHELDNLDRLCDEFEQVPAMIERSADREVSQEVVELTVRLEVAFHGAILQAGRNPEAARIVENIQILTHMAQHIPVWRREVVLASTRRTLSEHRAIVDAIRGADARLAKRLMRKHLSFRAVPLEHPHPADSNRQVQP